MTRITHAAALALSLVMTLAVFTSVAHLPSLSYDGAPLAQVQTSTTTLRS